MRFLSDENFRWDVLTFLKTQGHDVNIVPKRTVDKNVANLAKKEKRILLTNDADFLITLQFPPRNYYGILVFRIHPPRFERYRKALVDFLSLYEIKSIKGKTFLIEEDSFLEIE